MLTVITADISSDYIEPQLLRRLEERAHLQRDSWFTEHGQYLYVHQEVDAADLPHLLKWSWEEIKLYGWRGASIEPLNSPN